MKLVLFLITIQTIFESNYADIAVDLQNGAYEVLKGLAEVMGSPVNVKDVKFFIHETKEDLYLNRTLNPLRPNEIYGKNGRIFFFIHGWSQNRENTPWFKPLTEILLEKYEESTIIQVDWSKASEGNYALAAFSTESVGEIIANVIFKILKNGNSLENFVVIGHSLGGQISGWVGKKFFELSDLKLPRIIALDPAGPLFILRSDERRLNKSDADVVMVVHTDGGKFGIKKSCGTIDFFPNGGSDQPGCFKVDLAKLSTISDSIWCDHRRGYEIYVEAVRTPNAFMAKKCENYDDFKKNNCTNLQVSLGDLEITETGSFFLETSGESPFIKFEETEDNYTKNRGKTPYQTDDEIKRSLLEDEPIEINVEIEKPKNRHIGSKLFSGLSRVFASGRS